ncbi:BZ3500_MvSof-1268-A1-R1_C048g00175 [Microbotryum saponariae]|uniref:Autophagy protein 5 n=1 Tax=Microbotryum saponariae TaxID=289078 RepID=A0A2X0L243_9BASI|nr:BZ3500_MvSof-1268-A1-R1_Chr1-1g00819 [Microbotryum saponariae]SCZ92741.1 BZ3501_MvSof-1269-A2-R1_Chr1-1g00416 [Microbotryum saponariae]SCZ94890.1 BZ3500_MvSof-1268-A1-R1_C048g00175 [Microbotryum saponariae]
MAPLPPTPLAPVGAVSSSLSTSRYLPAKSRASSFTTPSPSTSTWTPSSPAATPSTVTASGLRSLVYHGSLPLQIHVAANELPSKVDPTLIAAYYTQASRISYLPLLLHDIKAHFLDLALDQATAATINLHDLWFEHNGVPLKWHWPIGLLYDYHSASSASSSSSSSTSTQPTSSSPSPSPTSSSTRASPRSSPTRELLSVPHLSSSSPSSSSSSKPFKPLELPWKLTLHLKEPPKDALLLANGVEGCRACFMNMVKEADYVRWGSVKRVTNLRKEQQDGLWEGVVNNDLDKFWSIASRLVPPPPPTPTHNQPSSSFTTSSRASAPSSETYNSVKSVPLRLYLPDGGPVLQDQCPPLGENGQPLPLLSHLQHLLPLLFPPPPSQLSFEAPKPVLAELIVQGVIVPLDTEVGWLGACLAGADGWVGGVVRILG